MKFGKALTVYQLISWSYRGRREINALYATENCVTYRQVPWCTGRFINFVIKECFFFLRNDLSGIAIIPRSASLLKKARR